MTPRGRFAPSPSGRMHLGNVYSAVLSYASIASQGGTWVVRIEDLDTGRCRREYADQLEDDLRWLGLTDYEGASHGGPCGPYYQSQRSDIYREAYDHLAAQGLVYPCYCTRADILAARAPHLSDGVVVYGGRCRGLSAEEQQQLAQGRRPAMRLMYDDEVSHFTDLNYGPQSLCPRLECGDFVVRRADGSYAYQLAVVVDDALMGITEVVRGQDLVASTHQQLYLYRLLGYDAPRFGHLPLLMSPNGSRLAKRDHGTDMESLRQHYTPQQILGHIAHLAGLADRPEPMTVADVVSLFGWERLRTSNVVCSLP